MEDHGPTALIEPRFGARLKQSAQTHVRAWLIFLGVALGLGIGGALVGDERALHPPLTVMGLAAAVAILIGVRMHHPQRRLPWQLMAICTALTTIGIGVLPETGGLGVVGKVLTAVGYVAGFSGFVMLVRGRIPGGDRGAFLDAAILASGIGTVIWTFGLAPNLVAAEQDTAAFFYPALIAFAVVLRMWFLDTSHHPTTRFLVLLALSTNFITTLDMLRGLVGPEAVAGPLLLSKFASLAFVGAAALHPSMALAPERQRSDLRPIGRRRIVSLTAALLVNPATLAIEAMDGRQIDVAAHLIGGTLIGVLVILRLGDALRKLGDSLDERDSLMELLRRQARYDALTSLPNRTMFNERLTADYANRTADRSMAVLLIDLDDFKAVNDSYGHEAGDALLIGVGQRLRETIRDGDTVARLGGDEFVIILASCADPLVPIGVAQRVLATLGDPFEIGGRSVTVRASVGVALAGPDDRTAEDLVRHADLAMYAGKSRGKGRFEVFEPSMQALAAARLELRTDLEAGISGGELRLFYQPVVDLQTGRTIGYEALVRWLRDGRLIAPGEFIAVAEASGQIGPLTDWVVDEACRTAAGWSSSRDGPWVSVNLSSSQLLRRDIDARLRSSLETTGLAPDRLVIEITESSLLEIDVARPALERLSDIGVRLAIDDFGIGYSALSYLARLPIDIVKIDRSFVIALAQAGAEEAIAGAIIALAKRLGLTTIGEGIETATQLDQLSALGCDLGQGFYLGRPVANVDLQVSPSPRARQRGTASRTPSRGVDPVVAH